MAYDFYEINRKAAENPAGFIAECDQNYNRHVYEAADVIAKSAKSANIVLLSGPSGSGKTTTAKKIEEELDKRGIVTHTVSMDNYFLTVDKATHRRNNGVIDFESPECMDIELLTNQIKALSEGKEVLIPKFDFTCQARCETRATPLRLVENDVAIFEGIHALNDVITDKLGSRAIRLYISARSDIMRDGEVFFKGTWTRLVRRLIRDLKFRGAPSDFTLSLWENVRQGEKKYISPFKNKSDIIFDSSLPYELPVLRSFALSLFEHIPDCGRREELSMIGPRLSEFEPLDSALVAPDSLIREFIGGGTYNY